VEQVEVALDDVGSKVGLADVRVHVFRNLLEHPLARVAVRV
jgi:hypothetical protein